MHHANHYYGHSHVLARYCGLDDRAPLRVSGYLQHGWNIGDGMAPDHEFVPGVPLFLPRLGPTLAALLTAAGERTLVVGRTTPSCSTQDVRAWWRCQAWAARR
ncbi:hypothetical protein [Micromonospora craniellae]|uniref:Uncharacterized protein n=1 Tax=Micromonospora craniellae TaxID=2294034 RepID=A0A372FX22_9ACTN|nr:hypothetical protein [Micromonospora craniellae]QOC95408.1 hypothetical protein ID554_17660 [Micromonospora craniellae]RFS45238.1 hypothetical protein D0Q02_17580 [Micromonospora craniellae]